MDEIGAQLIEDARTIIMSDINDPKRADRIKDAMNKMYRHFKSPEVYPLVDRITQIEIFKLEQLMSNEYLPLETKPDFNPKKEPKAPHKIKKEKDCEQMLRKLVHLVRQDFSKYHDLDNDPLAKECMHGASVTRNICEELGIAQEDFWCANNLSGGTFHCFNVVSFDLPSGETKNYIVDCTYRQFFTRADSFVERMGVMQNSGCCMGTYMLMNKSRKETAESLLKNGFIEMTPENVKNYFDGFVFQGRTGEHYEKLGKETLTPADYTPQYTSQEYLNALFTQEGISQESSMPRGKCKNPSAITFDYTSPVTPDLISQIRGHSPESYNQTCENTVVKPRTQIQNFDHSH